MNICDIQSTENYLRLESLDYFLENPNQIYMQMPTIKLVMVDNEFFKYFALDGNNRLYVAYKLELNNVPFIEKKFDKRRKKHRKFYRFALQNRADGIKSWDDLEDYIINSEEYHDLSRFP